MLEFKIKKDKIHPNQPRPAYNCVGYYIHTNFEITQVLANRISSLEGVEHNINFQRYYCHLAVATDFFDYKKVRNNIKKVLEDYIKEIGTPRKEVKPKKKKKSKKKNKMEFINAGSKTKSV